MSFLLNVVCMSAVAAGTGLAWTAPVLPQLDNVNATLHATVDEGTYIALFSVKILNNNIHKTSEILIA